jgi:hypothetical protein
MRDRCSGPSRRRRGFRGSPRSTLVCQLRLTIDGASIHELDPFPFLGSVQEVDFASSDRFYVRYLGALLAIVS